MLLYSIISYQKIFSKKLCSLRSHSEVSLAPRHQLEGDDGADRFRQSLKLAALKLQSSGIVGELIKKVAKF